MRRHLLSDVPVGLLLSGGVDSGLLLALMNEQGGPWPTYTVGYGSTFADDELADAAELKNTGLPQSLEWIAEYFLLARRRRVRRIQHNRHFRPEQPDWHALARVAFEELIRDARPEHAVLFTVEAWDVNCPQHIPLKLDAAEVGEELARLRARVAALEEENARLKGREPPSE